MPRLKQQPSPIQDRSSVDREARLVWVHQRALASQIPIPAITRLKYGEEITTAASAVWPPAVLAISSQKSRRLFQSGTPWKTKYETNIQPGKRLRVNNRAILCCNGGFGNAGGAGMPGNSGSDISSRTCWTTAPLPRRMLHAVGHNRHLRGRTGPPAPNRKHTTEREAG